MIRIIPKTLRKKEARIDQEQTSAQAARIRDRPGRTPDTARGSRKAHRSRPGGIPARPDTEAIPGRTAPAGRTNLRPPERLRVAE